MEVTARREGAKRRQLKKVTEGMNEGATRGQLKKVTEGMNDLE
jgi:hypothetical protein